MLEEERKLFRERAEEFMKYEGKYLVIKKAEILGPFDSPKEAYMEGIKRFGRTNFLLKQIKRGEPRYFLFGHFRYSHPYGQNGILLDGPCIEIQISDPEHKFSTKLKSLIDTGASKTNISQKASSKLKLINLGLDNVYTGAGPIDIPTSAVFLKFQEFEIDFLMVQVNSFLPPPFSDIECLLGRDVLSRWNFHYYGLKGIFEIEF